jgi:hypothetical protein
MHRFGCLLSTCALIYKIQFTTHSVTYIICAVRRDGRVVECTGLENRQGFIALLGFKSLSLRHIQRKSLIRNDKAFLLGEGKGFEPKGSFL